MRDLEEKLIVGAQIKIGKEYAEKFGGFTAGEIITLVMGDFEYDNGLYVEDQDCPAVLDERGDYDSIYHLFGNDLEDFMDCELLTQLENNNL